MVSIMSTSTVTRKSIPLDVDELTLADQVRKPGTRERAAVEAVMGPLPERLSEAQALSALIAVAQATVREKVISSGYADYAAALDAEDRAFAAATRARRVDRARRREEAGRA